MDTPVSQTGSPLLSILCITYNHARYIAKALDAFLAQQTNFAIEIVLADDCSTDETLDIVEGYRDQAGDRLHVLTSPINQGITRNFRRALRACRGKYVAICEGDDYWRGSTKLQTQVDYLERHLDCVITFHNATIVDDDGEHDVPQLPPQLRCDASAAELIATRPISTLTTCFRNVLDSLPPEFDQAPALDICLWSLLGHQGYGKYLAEIEPAAYRMHSGGVFSLQSERNRHLMTAQSLLCLARVYARQDQHAQSNALLLKANQMARVPLGLSANLRLFGFSLKHIIYVGIQRALPRPRPDYVRRRRRGGGQM